MRRFRHLREPGEIGLAASDVESWGYPRPVEPDELIFSGWWRYGPDVILWFQDVEGHPMTAVMHLCMAPSKRRVHLVAARRFLKGVEILADFYCLEHLIAADCNEDGTVTDYMRRLGWEPRVLDGLTGEWFVKDFPPFGEADEQASPTESHQALARG